MKLQRHLLQSIRADVRKTLGPQPADVRKYYDRYKREFKKTFKASNKERLLNHCISSDLILVGDYHTFIESQKTAHQLFQELIDLETPLVLALEMFPSNIQSQLDQFMNDQITEEQFLEKIDYHSIWGFPWEHYSPLIETAKKNNIAVLALNLNDDSLEKRDQHAANLICNFTALHPKHKPFILFGDLHLAKGHLPKHLKQGFQDRGLTKRITTVFQNSESIYWRLAQKRMEDIINVIQLGRDRYCIMNTTPWVKLQSFLQWADASELLEDVDGPSLFEIAHDRLNDLIATLKINFPSPIEFTIQTVRDIQSIETSEELSQLTREEQKIVRFHILFNRTLYIPQSKLIYIPSRSINAICEGVSMMAHSIAIGETHLNTQPKNEFYRNTIKHALSFFSCKTLNHKRKCTLEDDFRLLLERPRSKKLLSAERHQLQVSKFVLKHCKAQINFLKTGKYIAPNLPLGPSQVTIYLESARYIGNILGEKIFLSFAADKINLLKIQDFYKRALTNSKVSRQTYLELIHLAADSPIIHTSKNDRF